MTAETPIGRLLPTRYWDGITDTTLDAATYPYGNNQPGTGVQLTMQHAEQVLAVRLPEPVARGLALSILGSLDQRPAPRAPTTTVTTRIVGPDDFYQQGVTVVYRIAKTFDFEAAHQLHDLPAGHKCGRIHGHSYKIEVWLRSNVLDPTGFVADFAVLAPVGRYLDQVADHRTLNDLIHQPSSELLAHHLYDWVACNIPLPPDAWVEKVRVSETGRSWAEYAPEVTA